MKNFYIAVFLSLLLTLTVSAQFQVTVNGGYGSGKYKSAARFVHVWAAANPPNMVFDKWVGDTLSLADANAWHTRILLKQKNTVLTATYKNAPGWNPTSEAVNGSAYGYYFPPNVRGLVFRFHGSGGSGSSFFTKSEDRVAANDFVAAGFAVVSLDSVNRVDKQWSTAQPPNNPDFTNIQAIINSFIARGLITSATPLFTVGMSNGGAFSPRAAYFLSVSGANIKGAAVYCAQGSTFASQSNVPTTWNIAQYDDNIGADGNQGALTAYQIVSGRGIAAQYNINIPSPLYVQRFARISGLSLNDSQIIYDSLKNNGFLDSNNYLIQDPNTSGWENVIAATYNSKRGDIGDQLNVCYTAHQFFTDYNNRVIAFFNARI